MRHCDMVYVVDYFEDKSEPPVSVPFERSYWVAPAKCLAGAYPGDTRLDVARAKLQGSKGERND
jgi:hypothetical protein